MLERMNNKGTDFKAGEGSLVGKLIQEWDAASQIASAYSIGKSESQAALNLYKNCTKEMVEQLTTMVKKLVPDSCCAVDNLALVTFRKHTMGRFILHEPIALGYLNLSFLLSLWGFWHRGLPS